MKISSMRMSTISFHINKYFSDHWYTGQLKQSAKIAAAEREIINLFVWTDEEVELRTAWWEIGNHCKENVTRWIILGREKGMPTESAWAQLYADFIFILCFEAENTPQHIQVSLKRWSSVYATVGFNMVRAADLKQKINYCSVDKPFDEGMSVTKLRSCRVFCLWRL